jgi:hypothetical protein
MPTYKIFLIPKQLTLQNNFSNTIKHNQTQSNIC